MHASCCWSRVSAVAIENSGGVAWQRLALAPRLYFLAGRKALQRHDRIITQTQLRIDRATSWPSTLHEFMHEVNALGMVHSVAPFLFLISTTRHGWCDEMLMPDVCCSWCLLSFYCWTSAKCWTMGFFSHFCGLLAMDLVRALSRPCFISMA